MCRFLKLFLHFTLLFAAGKIFAEDVLPPYEKYVDEIINSFAQEMKDEFKITCSSSGGQMSHGIEIIEMGFVAHQQMNIEQARKLEILVIEKLVDKINCCQKIQPYLKERPFNRKSIEVFIAFRKEDDATFPKGSVAFVTHAKNCIVYLTNDPHSDKYLPLYKEPYDEAVKILKDTHSIQE